MERVFSSFSLITLGITELYSALLEVLFLKIKMITNKILRVSIFIGIIAVLLAFIVGFTSINNAKAISVTSSPIIKNPFNKQSTISINEFMNNGLSKHLKRNNISNKVSHNIMTFQRINTPILKQRIIPHGAVSRGGFINMFHPHTNSVLPKQLSTGVTNTTDTQSSVQPKIDISSYNDWTKCIGNNIIQTKFGVLTKCGLPNDYGNNIDYSTFKPYESYTAITNTNSNAYKVSHSGFAYSDSNGFRRYFTHGSSEFTVGTNVNNDGHLYGADDYIVALGTFYIGNECNSNGQRFLVVGENGMFTVRIGDAKADRDTDIRHMYSIHGLYGSSYAGLIEFIVDTQNLEPSVKTDGTVNSSSVKALSGKIKAIYRIGV